MTGGNSVGIAWRRVAWSALCLLLLMPILTRPGPLPAWDAVLRLGALSGLLLACLAEWGVLRARGVLVVSAVGCLALNWYAFRDSASEAGHGGKQKLRMAATWLTIIIVLALVIQRFTA